MNVSALLAEIRSRYSGYLPEWSDRLLDRFQWLVACGRLLFPAYRFKWPQMRWWDNAWFNEYLKRFAELDGMNTDRRWNLGQLLRLTSGIPGDTVECGSYRGAGSYLMCSFNAQLPAGKRKHHVFDSFEGLSEPSPVDGSHWTRHALSATEEEVHSALAEFADGYRVYKGWIPSCFPEVAGNRFSFVHIDVDLYQPTRDSIEFFYARVNPGGILLCDDYGFSSCPGATKAIDEFLSDKPEKMVSLASGGGFLIKGTPVLAPPESEVF